MWHPPRHVGPAVGVPQRRFAASCDDVHRRACVQQARKGLHPAPAGSNPGERKREPGGRPDRRVQRPPGRSRSRPVQGQRPFRTPRRSRGISQVRSTGEFPSASITETRRRNADLTSRRNLLTARAVGNFKGRRSARALLWTIPKEPCKHGPLSYRRACLRLRISICLACLTTFRWVLS